MTDQPRNPEQDNRQPGTPQDPPIEKPSHEGPSAGNHAENMDAIHARLERLGGEPAPDITPEEFARLRQSGQIHIDPRGRVRSHQRQNTDAGVSLRKRRAWYGQ